MTDGQTDRRSDGQTACDSMRSNKWYMAIIDTEVCMVFSFSISQKNSGGGVVTAVARGPRDQGEGFNSNSNNNIEFI